MASAAQGYDRGYAGEPARAGIRLDTVLCVALLAWLVIGTFTQDFLFRLVPGTMTAFATLFVVASISALRAKFAIRTDGPYPALYVFLTATVFALLLSFLQYPEIARLPRSEHFIARQAYFVVILPLALMTGVVFWRQLYTWLYEFCARYFLLLAAGFMAADFATAYFFGSPTFRSFNDYSQFADKLVLSFLFSFVYLARVTHPEKGSVLLPLLVLVGYYAATKFLTYGSLFQATTGTLILVYLGAATLLRSRAVLSAQLLLLGLLGLTCVLIVGTIAPELFADDLNSYWRFANWQANFRTLYETGFLGIGFGTPYFPVTTEELQHALTILKRGADPWTASAEPYDLVFLRAQHNSFVNMFYRTGLVGGTAFLAFNLILLAGLLRAIMRGPEHMRPHRLLVLTLLVVCISQLLLHVGIETPGFLIVYAMAAALAIVLTWLVSSGGR